MNTDELTLVNGNGKAFKIGLPKLFIIGYLNETAIEHIRENTGLQFKSSHVGTTAQPDNGNQIAALLLTYNFKTRYYNNAGTHNTLFLKSDHHIGFDVDSICPDCVKHNHIVPNISDGSRLAC